MIDFSSLASAILQLEKSLAYANSDAARNDAGLFEQLRNAVIHCFELTYALSHKMLKRYLEATAGTPEEIDVSAFQTIIRMGNEQGLLRSDWHRWKTYRQARTNSSHTYDADKAKAVYDIAPDFLDEARFLLHQLSSRNIDHG
jgi:nucleotidyltransferase substrate binding protein (TIGR01987 family)